MSKPLEVKHKSYDDMTEAEKAEMELVYRHLAPNYCVCQHRRDKHQFKEGPCSNKSTRMVEGLMQEYQCNCSHFTSIQEQAEETPERNY